MTSLFLDPKLFNYIIMSLYTLACIRWAIAGQAFGFCYWFCALGITATVTFLKPV